MLLCYFASEHDDAYIAELAEFQKRKLEAQSGGKKLKFVVASVEAFIEELKSASVLYIHGGNTDKLLATLRTFPDIKTLLEGRAIAGSSAGAYAIGALSPSHSTLKLREGLGLLPLRVVCHYDSPELPPNSEALELLEKTEMELELVLLRDFEWRVFKA